MNTDKITFVIPSRNNLEFLQLAYKSIRNLETKHDILVLNDASTDGTQEWIDSLYDEDSRFMAYCPNILSLEPLFIAGSLTLP